MSQMALLILCWYSFRMLLFHERITSLHRIISQYPRIDWTLLYAQTTMGVAKLLLFALLFFFGRVSSLRSTLCRRTGWMRMAIRCLGS